MKSFILIALLIGSSITSRLRMTDSTNTATTPSLSSNAAEAGATPTAGATSGAGATSATGMSNTGGNNASGTNGSTNELFPLTFWTDFNGKPGTDFIALKTINGEFVRCNDGKVEVTKGSFNPEALWMVVEDTAEANFISLRSYFGGYLNYANGSFDCQPRVLEHTAIFELTRDFGNLQLGNNINQKYAIALRYDNGYIGYHNQQLTIEKTLSENDIFIGLFKPTEISALSNERLYIERLNVPLTNLNGNTGASPATGSETGAAGATPSTGSAAGASRNPTATGGLARTASNLLGGTTRAAESALGGTTGAAGSALGGATGAANSALGGATGALGSATGA